jgi:cystathionine gamma-lyase
MHHGPVFAAPFHTPGEVGDAAYSYARSHNPTWTALEEAIAGMEGGGEFAARALAFGSGMAAVAAVFGALLGPGDVVVLAANGYNVARTLLMEHFAPLGVVVRTVAAAEMEAAARDGLFSARDGERAAKLVWIETPSNPTMEVCDLRVVCELAHAVGALVAVDNTTATPLGQRPLALGADLSVASDTKMMTGHSDLLIGHVAVRDKAGRDEASGVGGKGLYELIATYRTRTGGVLGPMEAWLALRSIATLPLRAERSCANALALAKFLKGRPEVLEVMYPGLESDPGHAVASRQMTLFGPVMSFVLKDKAAAEEFLRRSKLVTVATSFGGIGTTAERRARWGGDAVHEGLMRLSAGCEAIEDLIEDFAQALEGLG